jgi:hypothetical protein
LGWSGQADGCSSNESFEVSAQFPLERPIGWGTGKSARVRNFVPGHIGASPVHFHQGRLRLTGSRARGPPGGQCESAWEACHCSYAGRFGLSVPLTASTSPPERIANDGTAYEQSPGYDEAEGRGYGVERQQSCQPRKAQREHEAERASRYSTEPRADAGQRRADPIIR